MAERSILGEKFHVYGGKRLEIPLKITVRVYFIYSFSLYRVSLERSKRGYFLVNPAIFRRELTHPLAVSSQVTPCLRFSFSNCLGHVRGGLRQILSLRTNAQTLGRALFEQISELVCLHPVVFVLESNGFRGL